MKNFNDFMKQKPVHESQDRDMDNLLNELRNILESGYDEKDIKMMDWSEVPNKDIVAIKQAARILIKSLEF